MAYPHSSMCRSKLFSHGSGSHNPTHKAHLIISNSHIVTSNLVYFLRQILNSLRLNMYLYLLDVREEMTSVSILSPSEDSDYGWTMCVRMMREN